MEDITDFHNIDDEQKWEDSQNNVDDLVLKDFDSKYELEDEDFGKGTHTNFDDIIPLNAELLMVPMPICRLCALEIYSDEVLYIHETTGDNEITLADKINACLPITVSQKDNLPKQICSKCKMKLETTYAFSQCVTSAHDKIISFQLTSTSENFNCPLCCEGYMETMPPESENYSSDENGFQLGHCGDSKLGDDEQVIKENMQRNLFELSLYEANLNKRKKGRPKKDDHLERQNQDEVEDDDFQPGKKKSITPIKGRPKGSKNVFLKPKKMECFICSLKFRDLNHALVHTMSAHCDDVHETFPCPLCQTILTSEQELTIHINSHNFQKEISTIQCCFCDTHYLQACDINNHLLEKHPSPLEVTFSCPVCEQTTAQLSELVDHLVALHSNEEGSYFECPICELRLFGMGEFKQHLTENHIIEHKGIRCTVCGQTTGSQDANVRHMIDKHCPVKTHRVPSYYTCSVCSNNFRTQYHLVKHTCSVVLDKLDCDKCDKTFATKSRLVLHLQTHQPSPFSLKCHTCFSLLPDEDAFYDHVRFQHEPESRSECEVCRKVFKNNVSLSMHMRRHLPDRTHQCPECGKSFQSAQTLREHLVSHMAVKPFQCHICGAALSRLSRLRVHLRTHSAQLSTRTARTYKCFVCCQLFPNTNSAIAHCQSHQDMKNINFEEVELSFVYRCEFCDACFQKNTDLNTHRSQSHSDPNAEDAYKCSVCGAQFSTFARVTTHKLTHGITTESLIVSDNEEVNKENGSFVVPQYFSCHECDKKSLNYTYMSIHRRFQHAKGKQIFKCRVCNEKFATTWSYNHHRKISNHYDDQNDGPIEIGQEKNLLLCSKCDKPYTRDADLKHHEAKCSQTESLPPLDTNSLFICEICGKTFSLQSSLEAHTDAHRGVKKYGCKSCDRRFTHKTGLVRHMRLHSEDDPVACEFCGRRFRDRTERENHRRAHTGERPYMCDVCGRTFHTRAVWLDHSRIHQDIRPYRCDACGQTFRRLYSLKSHYLIHTGERPHECTICHKRFRLRQTLFLHKKKEHQNQEIPPVEILVEVESVFNGNDVELPVIKELVNETDVLVEPSKVKVVCSEEISVVTGSLWPEINITKHKMSWKSNVGTSSNKSAERTLLEHNVHSGQLPSQQGFS